MTVLQIIKDLAGEQDINWGDSDTTFARQTHTGGSTNINYVDSKSIPANTLGGVVDTHLHTQNTDTGTTETNFYIRSGSNPVILSATGVTGTRLISFPDLTTQLAGVGELSQTTHGYGASMIGVEDSAGYFIGTDTEAVLAELAADVAAVASYRGFKRGFKLGYSNGTTITISGGMWDHMGTTTQNVYTSSQISFVCGSAGSNSGSDDLDASNLHYIYIDDSAVVTAGTALLTASEFMNDKTAPAYDHSKSGWYNGNDRCIGCLLTTAGSVITKFFVRSDNYMCYDATIVEFASAAAPAVVADLDVSSSVPIYSTHVRLWIYPATDATIYQFTPKGGAVYEAFGTAAAANGSFDVDVCTDDSQVLEWVASAANTTVVNLLGYFIDEL